MIIEDVYKVLQEEEIQNLDDEMIEDVLAHHILFARERDVIHFFRFITLLKGNPERFNRLLTRFENSTVYSFWMGLSRCNERSVKRHILYFYSYMMEEYKIKDKIKYGVFFLLFPDTNELEEEERIRCHEYLQNWIKDEANTDGEVLSTILANNSSNPNERRFYDFVFLMSMNAEDVPTED